MQCHPSRGKKEAFAQTRRGDESVNIRASLALDPHHPPSLFFSVPGFLSMDRRGSISSTPSSSRIPLGKRTASTAGLESAAAGELSLPPSFPLSSLPSSFILSLIASNLYSSSSLTPPEPPATVRRTNLLLQHDLERRLRSAQARELELQSQLDDTKRELDSAKDVNRRLVEDDAWREEDAEKKRVQQEEEKVCFSLLASLLELIPTNPFLPSPFEALGLSCSPSSSSSFDHIAFTEIPSINCQHPSSHLLSL